MVLERNFQSERLTTLKKTQRINNLRPANQKRGESPNYHNKVTGITKQYSLINLNIKDLNPPIKRGRLKKIGTVNRIHPSSIPKTHTLTSRIDINSG